MKVVNFNDSLDARLRRNFNNLRKDKFSKADALISELLKSEPKVNIYFTPEAWVKMHTLVKNSSKEIGWHSTVVKDGNNLLVTDVLIYPQQVTAVTVSADEEKYGPWMHSLNNDTFNSLRGHGHSHVSMGTSPSGTDLAFYKQILDQLGDDDFYVFFIVNKSGDINTIYYDMAQGLLYEKADINISIGLNHETADEWYKKVAENVKDKPFKAPVTTKWGGRTPYQGYQPQEETKISSYLDEQYEDVEAYLNGKWRDRY